MRCALSLLLLSLVAAQGARGDPLQYDFLFMPSASTVGTFDRNAPVTQVVDEVLQADMLFSLQKGPLRLFGEYLVSDHERDLERFQLGWQLSDNTVIWIGRYHQPTSVWNHDHHHGQYLQTSITRPGIDEWEDLGGVLPQHFTGALIESSQPLWGSWWLRTAAGAGIAPELEPQGMEPFDLLHPDVNHRRVGYQGRMSLHPDDITESGFGVLAADDDLQVAPSVPAIFKGLDHVDLRLAGVFGTYASASWKLLITLYHADARLYYPLIRLTDSFDVGYLQGERRLPFNLTAFARLENSRDTGESPYLRLYREFARSRELAGLRWDFASRQALTMQLTDSQTLNGHFADVRLQWSAALF